MRYLAIQRKKAYPGCLAKARIYIEDSLSPELTISGVPCRFLDTIKNGEEKRFLIDHEARQVFLIFNIKTKDKLSSSVTIPAGDENVALVGKYRMDSGAVFFHFEGMELSPEQKARQQAQKKKNTRNMLLGALVGTLVGVAMIFLASGGFSKTPNKTFTKGDFSITLTEDFTESSLDDFYAYYQSDEVMAVVLQEDKALFGNMSLTKYADFLAEANGYDTTQKEKDGIPYFSYTATIEGLNYYYMVFCYESENAFWAVNFGTPIGNRDDLESSFMKWAQSVQISAAA